MYRSLYRKLWLSCLAMTLVAPGALYAMPDKDVKRDEKDEKHAPVDSSKSRKAKPGTPDSDVGKKKLKPRSTPNSQSPTERAQPLHDGEGEILWDTEFLVRNTLPRIRGTVVLAHF